MIYILKGKVSCLRLMAIIWTASSDVARQACGKAAARWGNAQAVTVTVTGDPSAMDKGRIRVCQLTMRPPVAARPDIHMMQTGNSL
jgi:hypothetical protein